MAIKAIGSATFFQKNAEGAPVFPPEGTAVQLRTVEGQALTAYRPGTINPETGTGTVLALKTGEMGGIPDADVWVPGDVAKIQAGDGTQWRTIAVSFRDGDLVTPQEAQGMVDTLATQVDASLRLKADAPPQGQQYATTQELAAGLAEVGAGGGGGGVVSSGPPVVAAPMVPAMSVGSQVSFQLALASGGPATHWDVRGLPFGVTVDPVTGLVTGKPLVPDTGRARIVAWADTEISDPMYADWTVTGESGALLMEVNWAREETVAAEDLYTLGGVACSSVTRAPRGKALSGLACKAQAHKLRVYGVAEANQDRSLGAGLFQPAVEGATSSGVERFFDLPENVTVLLKSAAPYPNVFQDAPCFWRGEHTGEEVTYRVMNPLGSGVLIGPAVLPSTGGGTMISPVGGAELRLWRTYDTAAGATTFHVRSGSNTYTRTVEGDCRSWRGVTLRWGDGQCDQGAWESMKVYAGVVV